MSPWRRPGPGTPVTVVGLSRSGEAAARWLLGIGCWVRVTEKNDGPELRAAAGALRGLGADVELGKHSGGFVESAQWVVTSPGVPPAAPPLKRARERGIPVVGEMELGSWYCPGGITAITGSNGKSTVVTLLGKILEAAGRDAVVCGNIGTPLTAVLHRITPRTEVVLEVSSFQLEETLSFHPKIGCLLNVSPNHLDRHGSLAGYRAAKARLFAWQRPGETALLNADDPACRVIGRKLPGRVVWFSRSRPVVGSVLQGGHLRVTLPDGSGTICASTELPKQGLPHEENGLAAGALAALLGVPPDLTGRVLRAFPGLPHRQQPVSTIHGVTFINDSKATTLEAGIGAIESMPGPVVLIAGGRDKGSDFRPLARLVGKLKAAVLIGEDGPKIGVPLKGRVPLHRAADMAEAVRKAFDLAAERGVVLLSPMCTSFDMFRDFEERGDRFIEAVRRLESPAAAPLGAGG